VARLNTRSFPCYCGICSAERGVASVLRSAAIKKVVPILSTRVEKVFLCLAAILNLMNARVLFIMAKRHPVRSSQCMKAIRDVESYFQEESFKIRNNQCVWISHWPLNTGSMFKIDSSNFFSGDVFNYVTNWMTSPVYLRWTESSKNANQASRRLWWGWLRIGAGGGLLCTRWWPVGSGATELVI
jgi:hypothetical protein